MIARYRPALRGSRSPAPGPADSMAEFPVTTFDLAALAVIGLSVLVGFMRGAIRETLTIVTWLGAASAIHSVSIVRLANSRAYGKA